MHTVAAVAGQDCLVFDLAMAYEIFGWDRSYLGVEWYDFRIVAADPPPVRTSMGLRLDTMYGVEELTEADTVIVPGWSDVDTAPSDELLNALVSAHDRGARLVSICTGAFVLAETGLLDGRPATTHWLWADTFSQRYPRVLLDPAVLYVDDGELLTSAGTVAGLDLCLHLVRRDHGVAVANRVAHLIVMSPHRDGGQAQFVEQPVGIGPNGSRLQPVLDWARGRLGEPLHVEQLAERAAMSPRTFTRQFKQLMGTTPGAWLLKQRLDLACRLLETTDETVERIAYCSGFGSAVTLRHHFAQRLHTTPRAYRDAFRTVEGSPSLP
jgi:AraC family transcriptional regulator, transcriptional activator FtrA